MASRREIEPVEIDWDTRFIKHESEVELGTDERKKPSFVTDIYDEIVYARKGQSLFLDFRVRGKKHHTLSARIYRNGYYSKARNLHQGNGSNRETREHDVRISFPSAVPYQHGGDWYLAIYYTDNGAPVYSRRHVRFN